MNTVLTPERLAALIEDAPVRALARLSLSDASPHVRHDASLQVAEHVLAHLDAADVPEDQLPLPLAR